MDFVMKHALVSVINTLVQNYVCAKQQCHGKNSVKM